MTELTAFQLDSETIFHVQSSLNESALPARRGARRGGALVSPPIVKAAAESWQEQLELVERITAGIVDKLSAAARNADQIDLEFGINLSSKIGVILVEGEGSANLRVKISWKPNAK
jgi:hypothetical protein